VPACGSSAEDRTRPATCWPGAISRSVAAAEGLAQDYADQKADANRGGDAAADAKDHEADVAQCSEEDDAQGDRDADAEADPMGPVPF
jgi:hypothetical protein